MSRIRLVAVAAALALGAAGLSSEASAKAGNAVVAAGQIASEATSAVEPVHYRYRYYRRHHRPHLYFYVAPRPYYYSYYAYRPYYYSYRRW